MVRQVIPTLNSDDDDDEVLILNVSDLFAKLDDEKREKYFDHYQRCGKHMSFRCYECLLGMPRDWFQEGATH